ncbi:MAG: GNAT family N-acetyltransferase [Candidatus Jettenia sp. CY-1]|nr:GNAT family N-acetyltransferase [Candidatus Jettenia sp.]WKZ17604.1 MAG: GNAT family N-acetyltransferase [Candidatus Jettenia sp. CY-1]
MLKYRHNIAPIHLRSATVQDIAAILELETAGFSRIEERFNQRQVLHLIANPRATVIVAESKGRVLGWAAGLVRRHSKSNSGRLYAVAVHPDAQGKYIGKRLVSHILNALAARGVQRIFLEVNAKNQGAINLYYKLGFIDQEYLADYYGPGHHGIRMVRLISPNHSESD